MGYVDRGPVRAVGAFIGVLGGALLDMRAIRQLGHGRLSTVLGSVAVAVSPFIAFALLAHVYGIGGMMAAVRAARPGMLAVVVGFSVVIQTLRAERARRLLGAGRSVSLGHSYAAMVLGHGIGDLMPLAPGGPALRSVLTERFSGIPVAFSAGAYLVEGLLDGVGLAILAAFVLIFVPLPSQVHSALMWTLAPVFLFAPLFLAWRAMMRRRGKHDVRPATPGWLQRSCGQAARGLTEVFRLGARSGGYVFGLSVLITGSSALQILLLLDAFRVTVTVSGGLLMALLTLAAGSLPVKFPGSGTVTSAAALTAAGIQGTGVAGYLLLSRMLFACQSTALALLLLAWWGVSGQERRLRAGMLITGGTFAPHVEQEVPLPASIGEAPRRRWSPKNLRTSCMPGWATVWWTSAEAKWRAVRYAICVATAMPFAAMLVAGRLDLDDVAFLLRFLP